jgi:hypothetical protein
LVILRWSKDQFSLFPREKPRYGFTSHDGRFLKRIFTIAGLLLVLSAAVLKGPFLIMNSYFAAFAEANPGHRPTWIIFPSERSGKDKNSRTSTETGTASF